MRALLHRGLLSGLVLVATFATAPPRAAADQHEHAALSAQTDDYQVAGDRQLDTWSLPALRVIALASYVASARIAEHAPRVSARAEIARARAIRGLLRVRMRRARRSGPDDF